VPTDHPGPDYLNKQFNELSRLVTKEPMIPYKDRQDTIQALKRILINHQDALCNALHQDYGHRTLLDSLSGDILPTVSSIQHTLKHLKQWMRPNKRRSGAVVHYQALGIVGIICPWNFPVSLSLIPAVQALAAGNRVLIKMSELSPNTGKLLQVVCQPLASHIRIINGDSSMGIQFSSLKFNHLVFTGSAKAGRSVMRSAANNLTPVTLELGGKSPVIVDETARLDACADALVFGKLFNSGQVCIAPDSVFIQHTCMDILIQKMLDRYTHYCAQNRITHSISNHHANRLRSLLDDAKRKGATIHTPQQLPQLEANAIAPTIVTNTNNTMAIMHEEIFGPLCVMHPYTDLQTVIDTLNQGPEPLALYIMSTNSATINRVLSNTRSGGVSVNDCFAHAAVSDAPFGGVGESGMGHYKGKEGFLTFSKAKTVYYANRWSIKNKSLLAYPACITKACQWLLKLLAW
jgi:coniferyl-aldehyde dehydrogenase